jgi:hypothetical protein
MLKKERSPKPNITSVLRKAWFDVWDTKIIPQPVCSINLCSKMMRWTRRQKKYPELQKKLFYCHSLSFGDLDLAEEKNTSIMTNIKVA